MIGIALSVVSVGVLAVEWVGDWSKVEYLTQLSVWLLAVREVLCEEKSLMVRFE